MFNIRFYNSGSTSKLKPGKKKPWKSSTVLTLIGAEHNNGADMLGDSAGQVEALQIQSSQQSMLYYYGKEYIINIIATTKKHARAFNS